jgi:malonyl-CoA/methylmalonyl-CoA synthetase
MIRQRPPDGGRTSKALTSRMTPSATDPGEWIEDSLVRRPGRVFLRTPDGQALSYAGLGERTGRFASALASLGVTPGDRVAVQVDKSADAVVLYVACLRLGAVFVPINVANTVHEVDYFLGDSEPRLAVVRPQDREALGAVAARARVPHLETLGTERDGSLALRAQGSAPGSATAPGLPGAWSAHAPAAIVYTSGTTGRPKGAVLTRGNLASNAAALADAWRFTADDVLLHSLPLFHVHGLFAAINTVLAAGGGLLLMPKFDAAAVVAQLPSATVYMGVPTHYTRLLQEPALTPRAAAAVRLFVSGSAPLSAATHGEFLTRTGQAILERYGMTETLMITSNPYSGPRVPGSVGPALPGVSVRVSDTGAPGVGGIEVKGPNVFAGYWRDPAKTGAEFTADGWFKTGDLGSIDGNGYVYIVGRAKDLVISGGYNVYPKEVEAALDAIAGVRESAVFGVPHADLGEGVTAAVVGERGAALSQAALVEALRPALAAYKIPKRIVFVDELPRNAMGKVQKNRLREVYASAYVDAARP